jgi:hypothetical protein
MRGSLEAVGFSRAILEAESGRPGHATCSGHAGKQLVTPRTDSGEPPWLGKSQGSPVTGPQTPPRSCGSPSARYTPKPTSLQCLPSTTAAKLPRKRLRPIMVISHLEGRRRMEANGLVRTTCSVLPLYEGA